MSGGREEYGKEVAIMPLSLYNAAACWVKYARAASIPRQLSFSRQPSWVLHRLGIRIHDDMVLALVIGMVERSYAYT